MGAKQNNKKKGISRRDFLAKSGVGISGLSLGLLGSEFLSCGTEGDDARLNIVVLVADDAGWNDVGYHGLEIETPNIDKLVQTGVELDRFYVYPTCSPIPGIVVNGALCQPFWH
jgi:sulfatase-like protein